MHVLCRNVVPPAVLDAQAAVPVDFQSWLCRRSTAQRSRAPAAAVQPSPPVTPAPAEQSTAPSPAVADAAAATASPASEAAASPSPSTAVASPATPLAAGFARRVTRQMSAIKVRLPERYGTTVIPCQLQHDLVILGDTLMTLCTVLKIVASAAGKGVGVCKQEQQQAVGVCQQIAKSIHEPHRAEHPPLASALRPQEARRVVVTSVIWVVITAQDISAAQPTDGPGPDALVRR
jgi:hypothetical protein